MTYEPLDFPGGALEESLKKLYHTPAERVPGGAAAVLGDDDHNLVRARSG